MKLLSIKYSQFEGEPNEWKLDQFDLNEINLIVGQNSDGKSRTLNTVGGLATVILSPSVQYVSGYYRAIFVNDTTTIEYEVNLHDLEVRFEKLSINGEVYLTRSKGTNRIKNILTNSELEFDIPSNQLAVARRDKIQYPYLEPLFTWATSVKHFRFGTELGKNHYGILGNDMLSEKDPDLRETGKVIELFLRGVRLYKQKFTSGIVKDFNSIGYSISSIYHGEPTELKIEAPMQQLNGLIVKENDRQAPTDQHAMSTGMFRALTIIIFFNFYKLADIHGTVIIDDIGEGLDFERSTKLIELIIDKSKQSKIQLLMSTNDRFVMNNVPLEYWQVINRKGGCVKMYNHKNHPEIFEDFKFTGLNNFDFFSTGFFKEGFNDEK